MKGLRALACLGVLMLGVALAIGCGGGAPKHFAGGGISFDYPGNWKTLTSDEPTCIAYLSEMETLTIVQVIKQDMPVGFTLETYHDNVVTWTIVGQPISRNHLTVAGVDAYETVFDTTAIYQDMRFRWVSLEKDGVVYDIACSAASESFDKVNKDFDTVINSFQFQ